MERDKQVLQKADIWLSNAADAHYDGLSEVHVLVLLRLPQIRSS